MRTTKKELVEKTITTYSCDTVECEFNTTNNSGCCGSAPIMKCEFCGDDCCRNHRETYWEGFNDDHPTMTVCQGCKDFADKVWEVSQQKAGRYDDLMDVVKDVRKNWDEYKWWVDGSEAPEIDMLWHTNYYDMPLEGIAEYSYEKVWFKVKDEYADEIEYEIYQLSYAEAQTETERHDMFRSMVGKHCDHLPSEYAPFEMNQETFDEYYQAKKSWEARDYTENTHIGTFPASKIRYRNKLY